MEKVSAWMEGNCDGMGERVNVKMCDEDETIQTNFHFKCTRVKDQRKIRWKIYFILKSELKIYVTHLCKCASCTRFRFIHNESSIRPQNWWVKIASTSNWNSTVNASSYHFLISDCLKVHIAHNKISSCIREQIYNMFTIENNKNLKILVSIVQRHDAKELNEITTIDLFSSGK